MPQYVFLWCVVGGRRNVPMHRLWRLAPRASECIRVLPIANRLLRHSLVQAFSQEWANFQKCSYEFFFAVTPKKMQLHIFVRPSPPPPMTYRKNMRATQKATTTRQKIKASDQLFSFICSRVNSPRLPSMWSRLKPHTQCGKSGANVLGTRVLEYVFEILVLVQNTDHVLVLLLVLVIKVFIFYEYLMSTL